MSELQWRYEPPNIWNIKFRGGKFTDIVIGRYRAVELANDIHKAFGSEVIVNYFNGSGTSEFLISAKFRTKESAAQFALMDFNRT